MYYIPEPPYLLLVVGLLAGLSSGLAFEKTLKTKVQQWFKEVRVQPLDSMPTTDIFIPFLGMCGGICLFLAAGLGLFNISTKIAYSIAIPITAFMGWLVWSQLEKLLVQLKEGGSEAIDLDLYR